MTTVEALQTMKYKLGEQGHKCQVNGACAYQDDDGNRCGIGWIVPDHRIHLYKDRTFRAGALIAEEIRLGETWCIDLNRDVMNEAQSIHDTEAMEYWNEEFDKLIEEQS